MAINPGARRQIAMMEAIEKRFARQMRAEILRASRAYVRDWEADGVINRDPAHEIAVAAIVDRFAQVSVRTFGLNILRDGGKSVGRMERKDFATTVARIARRYIMLEAVRRRIVSIAETTRERIVRAVQAGFDAGQGQAGIARMVLEDARLSSLARAAVIARTETHGAANYGTFAAAKETGLELDKQWLAAEDERTRESHAQADGQVVPMDQPFSVGGESLMYPGDPNGSAENVINCRCTVAYVPR